MTPEIVIDLSAIAELRTELKEALYLAEEALCGLVNQAAEWKKANQLSRLSLYKGEIGRKTIAIQVDSQRQNWERNEGLVVRLWTDLNGDKGTFQGEVMFTWGHMKSALEEPGLDYMAASINCGPGSFYGNVKKNYPNMFGFFGSSNNLLDDISFAGGSEEASLFEGKRGEKIAIRLNSNSREQIDPLVKGKEIIDLLTSDKLKLVGVWNQSAKKFKSPVKALTTGNNSPSKIRSSAFQDLPIR